MSVRTRLRRSLPYAVTIIGGFLLAYLVVAFVVFPSGVIPGDAKVPNVTGLLFDDAVERLAEVGFKAARGDSRYQGGSPKETVLDQDPRAGTREVEGSVVTLAVSAGQQIVAVPEIIGMSQADAQTALEAAGFELGRVSERPDAAPRGQVVSSQPVPGAKVPIPSSVSLVISAGPSITQVSPEPGRPR